MPNNSIHKKMSVLWDAAPCSLIETDRRFRGAYYSTIRAPFYAHGTLFRMASNLVDHAE
jgi:hypothetical protein